MEPSNELNLFDPVYTPSPALTSSPATHNLVDANSMLPDAELDKLLQSFVVPESFSDNDSAIAAWDIDQLLAMDSSLCV